MRRAFALFRDGGCEQRAARLAVSSYITWRRIASTNDLSQLDIQAIVDTLQYWKSSGEIEYRCRRIAETMQEAIA